MVLMVLFVVLLFVCVVELGMYMNFVNDVLYDGGIVM